VTDSTKNPLWEIGSNKGYIPNNHLELNHKNKYHSFYSFRPDKKIKESLVSIILDFKEHFLDSQGEISGKQPQELFSTTES
jgi:hypothetical protein